MEIRGIDFADQLDIDEEVELYCVSKDFTVWINKEDAILIIAHLQRLFTLTKNEKDTYHEKNPRTY